MHLSFVLNINVSENSQVPADSHNLSLLNNMALQYPDITRTAREVLAQGLSAEGGLFVHKVFEAVTLFRSPMHTTPGRISRAVNQNPKLLISIAKVLNILYRKENRWNGGDLTLVDRMADTVGGPLSNKLEGLQSLDPINPGCDANFTDFADNLIANT